MKKSRIISKILLTLFAAIFLFSGIMVFNIIHSNRVAARLNNELAQHLSFSQQPNNSTDEVDEYFTLPENIVLPNVDFDALYEMNSNVVAWIIIPGTAINYPVVHYSDNERYLYHLFDGTRNRTGAIFADARNNEIFTDKHTIIYGHNMNNGSMFAQITRYRSQEFFEENPYVFLLTPTGNYAVVLFAGYTANTSASSWNRNFEDDYAFEEWATERQQRSDFVSNIEIKPTDRIVTLSTCTNVNRDGRYVIAGRLLPIR